MCMTVAATAVMVAVMVQLVLSVKVFYEDVLPSRMAPGVLYKFLKNSNIKEFYTYNTPYNNPLVKTMTYSYPDDFVVRYVKTMGEVKAGIMVVPGHSAKSVQMETTGYAIENGDYREDPMLNKVYDQHTMEACALVKIRTMGSSKVYVHESEVTSYRDLILHQITDEDRWLAQAWVVDIARVHQMLGLKI